MLGDQGQSQLYQANSTTQLSNPKEV